MSRLWSVLCALVCVFACVHVMAVDMDSMAQPHRHHKSSSSSRRHANAATSTQAPTNKPSQAGPNNAFCGAQNIPYNDRTHKCCHHSNKVVRKNEHCPRYVPSSSSASSSSQQQVNKRVDSLQHEVDRLRAKEARREAERRREVQERERRERERREQARRMLAERERREREKKEKEREKKKKQQKPKKCGDETFNPATHRCCNCMPARVVPLSSNCPAADSSLSARCGGGDGVMYDPSRHKCCSNPVAVVDLSANCPPPPRQETSRRLLFQMCGEERCCAQRWTCPERCGSRLFDPDYQGCCNGKAYSLETQFCCNGCVYNKGCGYGCCNGQLYRKGVFTCCPVTLSVVMPGACSNQQTPAPTPAPSNSTTAAPTPAPTAAPSENGAGSSPNGGGVGVNGASEEVEGAELSGELANELAELAGGEESEDSLDSE